MKPQQTIIAAAAFWLMAGAAQSQPATPPAEAVNLQSHQQGIWSLPSPPLENRWLIIQNLEEGQRTGIYHIEVIARKKTAPKWDIKHLANHMAITADALARSVIKPMNNGLVYPESFMTAFREWQKQNSGKGGAVCSTTVDECLPAADN